MRLDNLFAVFNLSAMGMSYQRQRMNVISENLANLETTRTGDGNVYRRKFAVPNFNGTDGGGFLNFLLNLVGSFLDTLMIF